MKPRAWVSAALLVFAVAELVPACSDKVTLQEAGGKCEYDEQCQTRLVCKCVRRKNPDEEGPDEILAPGTCQTASYACKNTDAGPPSDTGRGDTGRGDTGAADTGAIDSATAADAADGG